MKNPAIKFIESSIIWAIVFPLFFWLLTQLGIINIPLLNLFLFYWFKIFKYFLFR